MDRQRGSTLYLLQKQNTWQPFMSNATHLATHLSLPTSYIRHFLALTSERGIPEDRILGDMTLDAQDSSLPEGRISLINTGIILHRALEAYGPELGYDVGLRVKLTNHGIVAYGLMALANGREVIEYGMRFMALSLPHLSINYETSSDTCQIKVRETVSLGPHRQFCIDSFLAGLSVFADQILAEMPTIKRRQALHFQTPEPTHFERYREVLPPCHFNASFDGMELPAAFLDTQLNTSDQTTASSVFKQCESVLSMRGSTERDIVDQVRVLFDTSENHYPTLPQAANALHLSERSLKRKLQQHGFSYQQLLNQARAEKAKQLLHDSTLNLADIAEMLGYANAPSFTRAFRQWTGMAPSAYKSASIDRKGEKPR